MDNTEEKRWLGEGNYWLLTENFPKAIECYDKAIKLAPESVEAYNNKGTALYRLDKCIEAIECLDKAIELDTGDSRAYNNKGGVLAYLGKHQEAIVWYDKAIKKNPDDENAHNNKGLALYNLGKYQEAIEYFDKAMAINPDVANTHINKGNALYLLLNYQEAINCYDIALEKNSDDVDAYHNKGLALTYLFRFLEAAECFKNAKTDIFTVFNISEEVAKCMLDDDEFFQDATKNLVNKDKIDKYKDFYLCSLNIQQTLQVVNENEYEKNVAHYTKKSTAEILLFDKEKKEEKDTQEEKDIPFRLNSLSTANDIQEGKTLFHYLFGKQQPRRQTEFEAFVGCFMFNHDNLNQFRLYGKEDNKEEGTGVSIVIKQDFFSKQNKTPVQQGSLIYRYQDKDKEPLFRCVYIDPETSQVVSIGHRDYHTFYHDGIEREIIKYKHKIEKKERIVTELLSELKTAVEDKELNLDKEIVCNLLLNLRYLVKHVAFKEEQECRIVEVKRLGEANSNVIDDEHKRMYVNYLPIRNHVKKIVFGPKATKMELFQNLLTHYGYKDVECVRSTSPLA
jgi:Tfp pilus assembly protein PilF